MDIASSAAQLPDNFICQLDTAGIVRVTGDDTAKYLQGQLTVETGSITPQQGRLCAHCDFKGKTWSVYHAFSHQQQVLLLTSRGSIDASLAELQKYGVFSQVDIEDVSESLRVFGGQGPDFEASLRKLVDTLPSQHLQTQQFNHGFIVRVDTPTPRYMLVCDNAFGEQFIADTGITLATAQYWQLQDIRAGLPSLDKSTQNEFIPQMLNLQAMHAIDFDKGCYMGQETVARTKYLGKNKRASFILCGEQVSELHPGDMLEVQMGENWRRGGTILNVATLGQQTWLLAVLPNDTQSGTLMRAKDHPDELFTVQPLPYSLD